jgi:hypothetical protein
VKRKLYQIKQRFKRFVKRIWAGPYYKTSAKYWVQKISFKRVKSREQFFMEYCENKDVLHFGCTDWPIFNPTNNLHIKLSGYTNRLDGFDIDTEGIAILKKYVDQDYYSDYKDIPKKKYDVCLIPETIEHVANVKEFLENIANINASKFLITAPNCFAKGRHKKNHMGKDYFIELVHPDHNCWYSPYTLKNQIEKYSTLKVTQVYLLENDRMICCEAINAS